MIDQLLWIDALAKLVCGAMVMLLPKPSFILLGLPRSDAVFYPRILGALLIGTAMALVVEGAGSEAAGLGLQGAALINLSVAATLAVILVFAPARLARRGRLLSWVAVAFLVILSLAQSLYA